MSIILSIYQKTNYAELFNDDFTVDLVRNLVSLNKFNPEGENVFLPYLVLPFLKSIRGYHSGQANRVQFLTNSIREIIRKDYYKVQVIYGLIVDICKNDRRYLEDSIAKYFPDEGTRERFIKNVADKN
jgi:hypothetical protein